jgi:hypothetical protein
VRLRDAISAHIEAEARRIGTYHGDPAATPGGTGYCIPSAVATQIVDKYLLDAIVSPSGAAIVAAFDKYGLPSPSEEPKR